jgi:putative transposase
MPISVQILRHKEKPAMPRAHRVYLPGQIWHITQRCHQREFLLRVRRDRRCWLAWLREARRRYGLCVLNYIVTCNHVHLLVQDRGLDEIAPSMQLVAGRTAQTYNERRGRLGAFWQGRYHATAVESDGHLLRCMSYVDLNMVRAGVVTHPAQWRESGYCEIQRLPRRYRIIDTAALCKLTGCDTAEGLRHRLHDWTTRTMQERPARREPVWTESVAVGSEAFLRQVKHELGARASARELVEADGISCLREDVAAYEIRAGVGIQRHSALKAGMAEAGNQRTGV